MTYKYCDIDIKEVALDDIERITEIYNSNEEFLLHHLKKYSIDKYWIENELKCMSEMGFSSYKIVNKRTNEIIGTIDFKLGQTTYLSLFIMDNKLKNQGIGKTCYEIFEDFIKSNKSSKIKIDVVKNYNISVEEFWEKVGYKKVDEVSLVWDDNTLKANMMEKIL